MPCPNALNPQPQQFSKSTRYKCFAFDFLTRDEWHDRAKIVCRTRHARALTENNTIAPRAKH
jgi:hypothetical protein